MKRRPSTGGLQELGSSTYLIPFSWTEDQIDHTDGDSNQYTTDDIKLSILY